jgi:hypothetical protein
MTHFNPHMQVGEPLETPSQTILKDAFAPVSVTDDTGRTIEAARLKPSERFAIKRMMGDEAGNGSLYREVFLIAHCRALDGERINKPTSMLQVMALMDRLNDEGLKALDQAIDLIYRFNDDESFKDVAKN